MIKDKIQGMRLNLSFKLDKEIIELISKGEIISVEEFLEQMDSILSKWDVFRGKGSRDSVMLHIYKFTRKDRCNVYKFSKRTSVSLTLSVKGLSDYTFIDHLVEYSLLLSIQRYEKLRSGGVLKIKG